MTAGVVYAVLAALLLAYAMRLTAADRKDKRARQAAERDAQRKHELAKAGDQG